MRGCRRRRLLIIFLAKTDAGAASAAPGSAQQTSPPSAATTGRNAGEELRFEWRPHLRGARKRFRWLFFDADYYTISFFLYDDDFERRNLRSRSQRLSAMVLISTA